MKPMTIRQAAKKESREYITPEDVMASIESGRFIDAVRKELLEIMGGKYQFGVEDSRLCAFIASRARKHR